MLHEMLYLSDQVSDLIALLTPVPIGYILNILQISFDPYHLVTY